MKKFEREILIIVVIVAAAYLYVRIHGIPVPGTKDVDNGAGQPDIG